MTSPDSADPSDAALNFADLTCIIPTHNRSAFLHRQLRYINSVHGFPNTIVVDSSGTEHASLNRQLVASFSKHQIRYDHQVAGYFEKLICTLRQVDSTYVVFCADDDTLSPAGLAECLQLLKANPDGRGVIGRAYILNTSSQRLSVARGHEVIADDPLVRVRELAENWFSNFYAIHHRQQLLQQLTLSQATVDMPQSRLLNELLNSLLAVSAGPLLYVDCDYLAFQIHDSNYSKTSSPFRQPSEYLQLREKIIGCLATYISDNFPETSGRCMAEVDAIVGRFLEKQKLPGQCPNRWLRAARKIQRQYRRVVGVHRQTGWLESQRIPFELERIRCADLRSGMREVLHHAEGVQMRPEGNSSRSVAA